MVASIPLHFPVSPTIVASGVSLVLVEHDLCMLFSREGRAHLIRTGYRQPQEPCAMRVACMFPQESQLLGSVQEIEVESALGRRNELRSEQSTDPT